MGLINKNVPESKKWFEEYHLLKLQTRALILGGNQVLMYLSF